MMIFWTCSFLDRTFANCKNVSFLCIFQGIKSGKNAQNFDKCQGKSHGFLLKSQGKSGKFFLRGLSEPCIKADDDEKFANSIDVYKDERRIDKYTYEDDR